MPAEWILKLNFENPSFLLQSGRRNDVFRKRHRDLMILAQSSMAVLLRVSVSFLGGPCEKVGDAQRLA